MNRSLNPFCGFLMVVVGLLFCAYHPFVSFISHASRIKLYFISISAFGMKFFLSFSQQCFFARFLLTQSWLLREGVLLA